MDLSNGTPLVAIPGPSILPDRVRTAMARPMPNIYEGYLLDMSYRILERLPSIARTSGHVSIIQSNGHGAWQSAISNTLVPGDKVLALESGRFAIIWAEYAAMAGVDTEVLPGDARSAVDVAALQARLEADVDGDITAIFTVQTDTATSVRNDIPAIRAAIDAAGHDALLMVDCIASMGCERFEMDNWGVDITVAASQKGLMCPPGLGFVWVSEKAFEMHPRVTHRVGYVDWARRLEPKAYYEIFAGTPPVPNLHALDEALSMIEEEGGLDAVWARHEALANGVRAAVEAWSTPDGIGFNITDPAHRSNAVTTIDTGEIDAVRLRGICEAQAGVTLGVGLIGDRERSFRIGHMGYLNPPMILGTLATIEAALTALAAPMGSSGVAAAAESIGAALRG